MTKYKPLTKIACSLILILCLFAFKSLSASASTLFKSASVNISATVYGPPPTVPSSIDSPVNGQIITQNPATLIGSCPTEGLEIRIYDNGLFAGSTMCQSDNGYSIKINLIVGNNQLIVKEFDWQGQQGPDSAAITVIYNPSIKSQPASGGSTNENLNENGNTRQVEPLAISLSDKFSGYRGYKVGQQLSLPLQIKGGIEPYTVTIDWQDGEQSTYSLKRPNESLVANHTYQIKGNYEVKISVNDASGQNSSINVLMVITGSSSSDSNQAKPTTAGSVYKTPPYVWSLLLLLPLGFFLGKANIFHRKKNLTDDK